MFAAERRALIETAHVLGFSVHFRDSDDYIDGYRAPGGGSVAQTDLRRHRIIVTTDPCCPERELNWLRHEVEHAQLGWPGAIAWLAEPTSAGGYCGNVLRTERRDALSAIVDWLTR